MNKRLSRSGFNDIAREFNKLLHSAAVKEKAAISVFDAMVIACADMFEADNPQFDRERFFTAVYKREGVKV